MHSWFAEYLQSELERFLSDPYDELCARLTNRTPFAFSRFGDGEFDAIFGVEGANCDGHPYFPELGRRLRAIIDSKPDYVMGLQPWAIVVHGYRSVDAVSHGIEWVLADSLHDASMDGRLGRFFDALAGWDVLIVGPPHLKSLAEAKGWGHLAIPARSCWTEYEAIRDRLKLSLADSGCAVLFCASMMSNVLVDDLYRHNPRNTYVDVGSLLDPYVGVISRDYHRKLSDNPLEGVA